jgi:pyruvate dehydrogenase E1 component
VLSGIYCFQRDDGAMVNLFGSGAIMTEVLKAAQLLRERGHPCNVWSVTSYNELCRQGLAAERRALLASAMDGASGKADEASGEGTDVLVSRVLAGEQGVFVAASDYMKALPLGIGRWVPGPYTVLGTDGFGLSEGRPELRDHFEVSAAWIAFAALATLARHGNGETREAGDFARAQGLDPGKLDPATA